MSQGVNAVLAEHLRRVTEILVPMHGDADVPIDGCRAINEQGGRIPLYPCEKGDPEPTDVLDIYEPRLSYIRDVIESLLSVVELESEGRPISIDGFRIKDPSQWLSRSGGAIDILAHAATHCNLNCRFCYNAGSPPAFQTKPLSAKESYRDILARIELYRPGEKTSLFPKAGSLCEALAHPEIKSILTALRIKTPELIRIPTNGSGLTQAMVNFLGKLQPVFLDISLNSASSARRKWLMRDPNPKVALESLAKLQNSGIGYSVVIVPWPFPTEAQMIADLEETIHFAASRDPAFIQISLPGHSQFFSESLLFDWERVWNRITEVVKKGRQRTDCPIILRPGIFEEYREPEKVNCACPVGVIPRSPAANAGLKPGDLLVSINGLTVKNRGQARSLLSMIQNSGLEKTEFTVERSGHKMNMVVDLKNYAYPFEYSACPYLGIVFSSAGVPISWVDSIRQTIRSRRASNVLVMTSTLVAPTLKQHIKDYLFASDVQLHLRIPANRYFGGNIIMGDLLTVDDFIAEARDFLEASGGPIDLIILPSSPFHVSGWGRDLAGKVHLELERRLGIPVALIECEPIFD